MVASNGNPQAASTKAVKKRGRPFQKGWKGGPGNPLAHQINRLRADLAAAVTREDVTKIAKRLIRDAKSGKIAAVHELFDRLFGKANQPLEITGGQVGTVVVTHLFDFKRFVEELNAVDRERNQAQGRLVPADSN